MSDRFVSQVARAFAALNPPRAVLIAASAGADSTAMAGALWASRKRRAFEGLRIVLGHVRHDVRSSEETQADWGTVQTLARALEVEAVVANVRLGPRGGLEQAAREARYAALETLAADTGCEAVVTGHTATDQAETLLLRLVRGAGARGLGAMRSDRPLGNLRLLRPMLGATREEARAYCHRSGLVFRDDPTNIEQRPRMTMRDQVLPVLDTVAPHAVLRMAAAAHRLQVDEDFLETEAARRLSGGDLDQARNLAQLPQALRRRALMQWCERSLGTRRRVSARHLEALEQLVVAERGEVQLPSTSAGHQVAVVDTTGRLVLLHRERANRSAVEGRQSIREAARRGSGQPE